MEMQAFQHKIYLKPYLTEEKEVKRMEHCIYMIDGSQVRTIIGRLIMMVERGRIGVNLRST